MDNLPDFFMASGSDGVVPLTSIEGDGALEPEGLSLEGGLEDAVGDNSNLPDFFQTGAGGMMPSSGLDGGIEDEGCLENGGLRGDHGDPNAGLPAFFQNAGMPSGSGHYELEELEGRLGPEADQPTSSQKGPSGAAADWEASHRKFESLHQQFLQEHKGDQHHQPPRASEDNYVNQSSAAFEFLSLDEVSPGVTPPPPPPPP
eukprot:CAMPEP_0113941790 /NCGR_PEP_ID=MMETSP1339-20121228/7633_1 /TAXON_ID=94617 /ORGANISM="Fibrocapsa japonica" /LENGTH=201 /DNA_ID=CAMNT_0000946035 /DNA_START=157 /DNA_END=758 /DNA_ORIENTATION=- /assembly_acc=CAM_ASM_000762